MASNAGGGLRALVGIKRVIDYAVKVRVRNDRQWVETEGVKHSLNPFDEIAVEAALRLKEKKLIDHITVVSCGNAKSIDVIRTALAMGADAAVHVDTSDAGPAAREGHLQPLAVAKLLKAVVLKQKPDLIILGKQAIDDDANQTGQLLAGLLDWPQATFASEITPDPANSRALRVVREVEGGLQTIKMTLPAVITTDLRLNEPRYATLQNIMKAKQKPILKETPATLGIDIAPRLEILEVTEPPKRSAGRKLDSVDALIKALREEARVI